MTEAEYRAHPGISQSRLAQFSKSPQHYKYGEVEQTQAMRIGSILHTARFEPEVFRKQLLIEPDEWPDPKTGELMKVNKRVKLCREYLAQWRAHHKGRIILTSNEFDDMMGMLSSLAYNPTVKDLFSYGQAEVAGIGTYNDLEIKGRADFIATQGGRRIGIDLKKTQDAGREKFQWTIQRRHYDLQAFWYTHLFGLDEFYFIAVEEKPFGPGRHGVGIYRASRTILDTGEAKAKRWTDKLKECLATDHWPSYTDGVEDTFTPDYILKKLDEGEV
jgi:hypothetical protein